jgi:uncharacterized protein (DUF1778 family)
MNAKATPLSLRVDPADRKTLAEFARGQKQTLAEFLRNLIHREAVNLRKARIHTQSAALAEHMATTPEAAAFFEDWSTPSAELR